MKAETSIGPGRTLNRMSKSQQRKSRSYELKLHKTCFDEKFLRFVDQTKHVKMQWLQDPTRKRIDNLNTVRHEASR
jgi:hypothetical protein